MSVPSYPPGQAGPARVAIPRLPPRKDDDRAAKARVPRACVSCRARKIKCDGVEPKCRNCTTNEQPCVYVQSRRDRLKTATAQNVDILNFLQNLRSRVGSEDQHKIDHLLGEVGEDVSEAASSLRMSPSKPHDSPDRNNPDELRGEADVDAEVGSNEDMDILDENLLQDNAATKATGFVGKSSELQWLRHLQQEIAHPEEAGTNYGPYGPPGDSSEASSRRRQAFTERRQRRGYTPLAISNSTYYLDIEEFQPNFLVDQFEMPSEELAERLLATYLDTVHDSFPIFSAPNITTQLRRYYAAQNEGKTLTPPDKWQALINMIFAIAAYNSHLLQSDWQADSRDHYVYHTRARMLAKNQTALTAHPDLHQIQITALFSIYYMCIGHVSRAWVLIGVSLRYAYALGLHVRNEDKTASALKREILVRMWWGLYTLERNLSTLAGRPSVVMDFYCSVPLPLPLSSSQLTDDFLTHELERQFRVYTMESSRTTPASESAAIPSSVGTPIMLNPEPTNSGTYLKSRVGIGRICQKVMVDLYSAGIVMKSWEHVQQTIMTQLEDLERWASALPAGLDFNQSDPDSLMTRERFILQLDYLRLKILITRPCLCRLDRRIVKQSQASVNFNNQMGLTCVTAAIALTKALPDPIDPNTLYQIGPWWCIVHNLMQGLAALLLELAYGTVHKMHQQEILPYIKILVRWLRVLRGHNRVAGNAYVLAFQILKDLAVQVNADISELIQEDAVDRSASFSLLADAPFSSSDANEPDLPQHQQFDEAFNLKGMPMSPGRDDFLQYEADTGFPPEYPQGEDPPFGFEDLSYMNFSNTLSSNSLMYTNPFLTTFDEQNPIPAISGQQDDDLLNLDTDMPDVTQQRSNQDR